jgi:O-antigen/teichoic acid export membrane protein
MAASAYYTTVMPAQLALAAIMRLMNSCVPAFNELLARNDLKTIQDAYYRIVRYSLLLALPLAGLILAFTGHAVSLWVGATGYAGSGVTAVLAVYAPWVILSNIHFQSLVAVGKVQFLAAASVAEAALKIGLSYALGTFLGLVGVILGTLLASLLITPWIWRACYHSLSLRLSTMFDHAFIRSAAASLPVLVLSIPFGLCPRPLPPTALASVLVGLAIVWSVSVWHCRLTKEDRVCGLAAAGRYSHILRAVRRVPVRQ